VWDADAHGGGRAAVVGRAHDARRDAHTHLFWGSFCSLSLPYYRLLQMQMNFVAGALQLRASLLTL
jgi:hypothetical protein